MKKIIYLGAILLMALALLSCNKKDDKNIEKLICGVTLFEPMNYLDGNGNWTGFETEFAQAVGGKLGLQVEFQEIEWGRKFIELEAGTISCIWNGLTANVVDSVTGRERYEDVDFSYSYMLNQQAVVIRAGRAGEFTSIDDLLGKVVAAEAGSAGESIAKEAVGDSGTFIGSSAQIDTFIEVKSGAVDFAMVDIILAEQIAGSGDNADLMIAPIPLPAEVYAVGFSKGSSLTARVNQAMQELFNDGTMLNLAKKYGLETTLKLDTTRIEDL